MNDFDLDAKLRGVPVPERTEDYWNDFPAQVRMNLRPAASRPAAENCWRPRLAWAGGVALVLMLGLGCAPFHPLKTASLALTKHERHLRLELAQFHTQLKVFMRDEHGLHHLIAEKE